MENNKMKILICDDEQAIRHALELKLTHEGFDVVTTPDGNECVSLMSDQDFDLLLLDLVLPQKDGFAILEELKLMKNKVPVIIISNLGQEEDIKRVKELGVVHYLIKSNTSINDMVEKVKSVLNK
ncbi:response regulator [Candidatus Nomurabacteria bacterium]|nr:response regulator [Candidatus Nomurabacteria bacterium]